MAAEFAKMEEIMKVKITSNTHVKPNKTLGKINCDLVTFDLPYLGFYYNQKLLLYKGDDFNAMVNKLKHGLQVVLDDFYQLAGKLGKDEDGVFRVEYDDKMTGVEVIVAEAEMVRIDDVVAVDDTSRLKDLIPYNGVLNLEGTHMPLLAVQLTKVRDGLSMGCAFNHAILDGTATWHFLSSWAHICNGSNSIPVRPFLNRTQARATRVKLDESLFQNLKTSSVRDPPLREKIFRFSESTIDKIKSTVNSNSQSNGSQPFSTFQSISVHIWRHVTQARNLKPDDVVVFVVFADCRKRVNPPMSENYFGNLIQAIFTGTAAGLLLYNPPEFGAAVIQQAIKIHDENAIKERNKEWERSPKIFQYKDAGANCVAVGSSPRFKVYEVDFGWGKAESVRSGVNNRFDGMVYLYEGKNGGRGIDVEISLKVEVMERLEKDEEFLMGI